MMCPSQKWVVKPVRLVTVRIKREVDEGGDQVIDIFLPVIEERGNQGGRHHGRHGTANGQLDGVVEEEDQQGNHEYAPAESHYGAKGTYRQAYGHHNQVLDHDRYSLARIRKSPVLVCMPALFLNVTKAAD